MLWTIPILFPLATPQFSGSAMISVRKRTVAASSPGPIQLIVRRVVVYDVETKIPIGLTVECPEEIFQHILAVVQYCNYSYANLFQSDYIYSGRVPPI